MTGQTIRRRLEKIEALMAPDNMPKIRITRIYVEAADGCPTGKVLIVRDGREVEEFRDPAAIHRHEIMWYRSRRFLYRAAVLAAADEQPYRNVTVLVWNATDVCLRYKQTPSVRKPGPKSAAIAAQSPARQTVCMH
jgi:hypothetical protein